MPGVIECIFFLLLDSKSHGQPSPRTPSQLTSFNNHSFDSWPSLPSTRKNSEISIADFDRRVTRSESDAASRITEIEVIPNSPQRSPDPLNLPDPNAILADDSRIERTPFNWENNDVINPTYVGLSRKQSSALQRVYDYTSTNYSRIVQGTTSAAERVTNSFGALRDRVRVPNIRIPGSSDNQYYSNLRMVFIL